MQPPVVGDVILRAGFKNVNAGSTFRSTMMNEQKLYASSHVFDVNERGSATSSVLRARCVRQANVSQEAYAITVKLRGRLPCCSRKIASGRLSII